MSELVDEQGLAGRAQGSSFYMAMRILPREQRAAILAVYGFCRAVDDIADEPSPDPATRLSRLEEWRAGIARLYAGSPPADLCELVEPVRRYGLRQADFEAVIDGMEMDATSQWRAPDWATLDLYVDRVASAVGRLSVRIFGLENEPGDRLAHHLGRALQLTNILRDLDEDFGIGRLYLPREALLAAGIPVDDPAAVLGHPALTAACTAVAGRAEEHFGEAQRIMDASPRRAVRAPRLMAAAYRNILARLIEAGWAPPRQRISTDRLRLAGALIRYGLL